jgi:hypothetical protein
VNRRGSADIGIVLAMLLLLGVMTLVGYKVFDSYNDKWQAADVDSNAKQLVQTNKDRYVGLFDGIFMFVFALLVIALFVSVAVIGTQPQYFFITLIVLVMFIGASGLISNSFEDVSTSTYLNETSSEFEFIPFLMGELPMMTLFLGIVLIIGLYLKIRGLV